MYFESGIKIAGGEIRLQGCGSAEGRKAHEVHKDVEESKRVEQLA